MFAFRLLANSIELLFVAITSSTIDFAIDAIVDVVINIVVFDAINAFVCDTVNIIVDNIAK